MRKIALTAALLLGTSTAALATVETKLIDGCVMTRTNTNTWQRARPSDPACAFLDRYPANGPRDVRVRPYEDEDEDEGEDDGLPETDKRGNASANNGKGGNYDRTGHDDNGRGRGRNR
jgi:hypothetical protein